MLPDHKSRIQVGGAISKDFRQAYPVFSLFRFGSVDWTSATNNDSSLVNVFCIDVLWSSVTKNVSVQFAVRGSNEPCVTSL